MRRLPIAAPHRKIHEIVSAVIGVMLHILSGNRCSFNLVLSKSVSDPGKDYCQSEAFGPEMDGESCVAVVMVALAGPT